jgi:hypothetical protein
LNAIPYLKLFFSCGNKPERDVSEELNDSYANVLQEQINVSNKIQQSIYDYNTNATVKATANSGYSFSGNAFELQRKW